MFQNKRKLNDVIQTYDKTWKHAEQEMLRAAVFWKGSILTEVLCEEGNTTAISHDRTMATQVLHGLNQLLLLLLLLF